MNRKQSTDPKYFLGSKILLRTKFFRPNLFFSDTNFFDPKLLMIQKKSDLNFFGPKSFIRPKHFCFTQIFFPTKLFLALQAQLIQILIQSEHLRTQSCFFFFCCCCFLLLNITFLFLFLLMLMLLSLLLLMILLLSRNQLQSLVNIWSIIAEILLQLVLSQRQHNTTQPQHRGWVGHENDFAPPTSSTGPQQ